MPEPKTVRPPQTAVRLEEDQLAFLKLVVTVMHEDDRTEIGNRSEAVRECIKAAMWGEDSPIIQEARKRFLRTQSAGS